MRECATHHHACDCMEAEFKKISEENEFLRGKSPAKVLDYCSAKNVAEKKLFIAMVALSDCGEVICSAFCSGSHHHTSCRNVSDALEKLK